MKLKRKDAAKAVLLISCLCLGILCISSFSATNDPVSLRYQRDSSRQETLQDRFDDNKSTEAHPRTVVSPLLAHHPFDNKCQFPIHNIYPQDIRSFKTAERLRTLQCPPEYPFATQDSEGYIYIHPHYTHYPNVTKNVECKIVVIEGGLRKKGSNAGKNDVKEVAVLPVPENTRLWVNADAFYVRCFDTSSKELLWQKIYAGIFDDKREKNKVFPVPDLRSVDNFGRIRPAENHTRPNRYSIDILGFDSTSRTMFYRHLPRTAGTMHRLGFEFLYGYNKVADNSMVNLAPILIGDVPQALEAPKLDDSGDINVESILPSNKKIDPTELQFLWKWMTKEYGCKSMFNEDISMKELGLFTYPNKEFKPGFTENPATHYYRAFYLAVYKKWNYGPCRDGVQIQRQFVELWSRFASQYRDICHFGFTFVTTLTHETPILLELMDEFLGSQLEHLEVTGVLDSGVQIILGDHGNRIGAVQYSYSGRIEERMPLMAIRLPSEFKRLHPEAWSNFQKNKYRLTSNFDIHQTLRDVAEMNFVPKRARTGRGISMFDEIPVDRSCFDAHISENFCTCLVDRSNITETVRKMKPKSEVHRKSKSIYAIRNWITESGLNGCLDSDSINFEGKFKTMGLNTLARLGLRTKANVTVTEKVRRKKETMDFLHHQFVASIPLRQPEGGSVQLEFRIDDHQTTDEFIVGFEPAVRANPVPQCNYLSIFEVCQCLGLDSR